MADEQKPAPITIPMKLLAFEILGVWVAVYFILGASSPDVLTGMGLPVLVHGNMGYVTGILAMLIGGMPLINWLIAQKRP